MERGKNLIRDREMEGSDRSAELATALAQIADPDMLEQLVFAISALQTVGGQFYIGAFRNKYALDGERIPKERLSEVDGDYETDGYVVNWNSHAEVIRGALREPNVKLPADPPPEPGEPGGPVVDPIDLAAEHSSFDNDEGDQRKIQAAADGEPLTEEEREMHFPDEPEVEPEPEGEPEEADAPPPADIVDQEAAELEEASPLPKDSAFAGATG